MRNNRARSKPRLSNRLRRDTSREELVPEKAWLPE